MNVSKFTSTVRDMRDAQKRWFKTHLRSALIEAKKLEKRVDDAISEGIVFDLDIVTMQGDLFVEENFDEE